MKTPKPCSRNSDGQVCGDSTDLPFNGISIDYDVEGSLQDLNQAYKKIDPGVFAF